MENKDCNITNFEMLKYYLNNGDKQETVNRLLNLCTLFNNGCGSCDVCANKIKEWGDKISEIKICDLKKSIETLICKVKNLEDFTRKIQI